MRPKFRDFDIATRRMKKQRISVIMSPNDTR